MEDVRLKISTGQIIKVPHQLETGQKIELGIRPENMTLNRNEHDIKARVIVTEPTGVETFVNRSADGVEILASIKELIVRKPEDKVFLEFDSVKPHFFCVKTGLVQ